MEQHFTVTTKHYVKTLERALKLYTPSLHEKSLSDFLATVCEDLGFRDIHTDDVGNIIATKGWLTKNSFVWTYGYCTWKN